jgi:hypothetical protein
MMTHTEALGQAWPTGIATCGLRGIEDAIKLGTTVQQQYWFRGHPRFFSVLPKVYREPFYGKRPNLEYWPGSGSVRVRATTPLECRIWKPTSHGC